MLRQIFKMKLTSIASKISFASFALFLVALSFEQGQEKGARLRYFVAPEYPNLARQAMLSGDVRLILTIDGRGIPTEVTYEAPYPLLGSPAKDTVSKWRFDAIQTESPRKSFVTIHYGFSGTPKDCNPNTTVNVDLDSLNIIVTVDPRLPFEGDSLRNGNGSKNK